MIDQKWVGHTFAPYTRKIEEGQLWFFAKAIGETNPIFLEKQAAKTAGYTALPAPPTYGFSLSNAQADTFDYTKEMGIPIEALLHGEEEFEYIQPILAGDEITFQRTVLTIYEKKGGLLEFVKMETTMINQDQALVGKMQTTFVVRHDLNGLK